MKKVLVLMSTYNGEKYIKEQLDSIFLQESVNVYCSIRDDGSTDATQEIINDYATHNSKINFLKGDNVGWAQSFYSLVENNRYSDYDYYAFSDQDDVWESNKLISAIQKLEELDSRKPLLYCSNLKVVDNNLNWVSEQYMFSKVNLSKEHALVESFSTGCTQVFNHKMKDLYLIYKPYYLHAHDYWLYLVGTFIGQVIYDDNAYIKYRQHYNNVKGAGTGLWELWKKRIKLLSKQYLKEKLNQHPVEYMAQELLKGYSVYINEMDIKTVETVALYRQNLWTKLVLFLSFDIRRISFSANLGLRIRILLGIA